ncbi:hypothetical protein [Entomospira culicis]|uniref:Uncharacterized protein n=1 Tax=Entomospira culicis TaxID=2719989 RepID=A0A968KUX5_9SPIO|nr:hypothetical protein [Entomospira culicis]NIZ19520.1 hypothetical protein [Entomospira culicis]NIZ69575.1 hypothetical protein [Entomospira culicis]WDI36686.1 hypothetical protein PVA46_05000 [Entomospira culicis]WDI38315.1 hypothetical protein PVA47_05010 [Entomospira culicis]
MERNERFEAMVKEYEADSVNYNVLLNLLFLLMNEGKKVSSNPTEFDKQYEQNREALEACYQQHEAKLKGTFASLTKFLAQYNLDRWFYYIKKYPLYFVAYHLFHQENQESEENFSAMAHFVQLAEFNSLFSKRASWKATVAVQKSFAIMKAHQGEAFPINALLALYEQQLPEFQAKVTEKNILKVFNKTTLNKKFLLYLIYDGELGYKGYTKTIRYEDDHIHSCAALKKAGFKPHYFANRQLLLRKENRSKGGKAFGKWVMQAYKTEADRDAYLKRHLIPSNPELWKMENYHEFLVARSKLILDKIKLVTPALVDS